MDKLFLLVYFWFVLCCKGPISNMKEKEICFFTLVKIAKPLSSEL